MVGVHLLCLDGRTGRVIWEKKDDVLHNLVRQYQYILGRESVPGFTASAMTSVLRMIGVYKNDVLCFDRNRQVAVEDGQFRQGNSGSFGGFSRTDLGNRVACGMRSPERTSEKNLPWDGGCGDDGPGRPPGFLATEIPNDRHGRQVRLSHGLVRGRRIAEHRAQAGVLAKLSGEVRSPSLPEEVWMSKPRPGRTACSVIRTARQGKRLRPARQGLADVSA